MLRWAIRFAASWCQWIMDQQFNDFSALPTPVYHVCAWSACLGWLEGIPAHRVLRTWF